MCLIVFAYQCHPKYKFILAANRDEFYNRSTAKVHWWEDQPDIFGGRDLEAHGTWMAIHKNGRFAAVTNYRDLKNIRSDAQSRGDLPVNFLASKIASESYAKQVFDKGQHYNGFNLITLDNDMTHVSNYDDKVNILKPGIYGLSNALLDTPWPKVSRLKKDFQSLISHSFELEDLISIMQNTDTAADQDLPETGLDYAREKALSAMFIETPGYGTCCSTAITIDHDDHVQFLERSYPVGGREAGLVKVDFLIEQP